jgi:hypothetical protein
MPSIRTCRSEVKATDAGGTLQNNIRWDVKHELRSETDASDIAVDAKDGIVTLSGFVRLLRAGLKPKPRRSA